MKYDNKKVWLTKKGYPTIWLNGKSKMVHILEWEKHNGPKPKGYQVHHKDENKANWNIDNLQIETQSDHLRIHAGWIRNEFNLWILKPCKDCKKLLFLEEFYQRKGMTPSQRCIDCSGPYFKKKSLVGGFKKRRKLYMKRYYQSNKSKWKNYES